jgi:hypothetical protein
MGNPLLVRWVQALPRKCFPIFDLRKSTCVWVVFYEEAAKISLALPATIRRFYSAFRVGPRRRCTGAAARVLASFPGAKRILTNAPARGATHTTETIP